MKKTDWKDTAELVGIAAIVASLVFVGIQLKQDQEIAKADTSLARAWATVDAFMMRVSSPTLNSAEAKLWVGEADALRPDEIVALYWNYNAILKMHESNFDQYQRGFLDFNRWENSKRDLHCLFSNPVYREFRNLEGFTDNFRDELERIYEAAGKNPSSCFSYEPGSIFDYRDRLDEMPSAN